MSTEKTEPEPAFQFTDQAEREWLTWRQVCKHLEKHGIVVNDPANNALILAIKLWGEEQVALTYDADAKIDHEFQLGDLREKYVPHVLDGWAP